MGYPEERKARDAGEEAYRRGYRSSRNPYEDHFGGYEEERCHREWDDGYRCQERLDEERREEEENERRREAHLAEQRRQAYQEEEWRMEEEREYERQQEEELDED